MSLIDYKVPPPDSVNVLRFFPEYPDDYKYTVLQNKYFDIFYMLSKTA